MGPSLGGVPRPSAVERSWMTMLDISVKADDISSLVTLLERQIEVVGQFADLTVQQSSLVEQGQTEELLTLLSRRQQLISVLDGLSMDLEPFRSRWRQMWQGLGDEDQQRISQLVNRSEVLLGQIVDADDRDRGRLRSTQRQIADELSRVNKTGVVRRAYAGSEPAAPNRFTDKKG